MAAKQTEMWATIPQSPPKVHSQQPPESPQFITTSVRPYRPGFGSRSDRHCGAIYMFISNFQQPLFKTPKPHIYSSCVSWEINLIRVLKYIQFPLSLSISESLLAVQESHLPSWTLSGVAGLDPIAAGIDFVLQHPCTLEMAGPAHSSLVIGLSLDSSVLNGMEDASISACWND